MKTSIYTFALLCCACAKPVDFDAEKTAITKLIDDETKFAAAADTANWAKCWAHSPEATFTYSNSKANGYQHLQGWTEIKESLREFKPFELKLARSNFQFLIENNLAFVTFDQDDNWGNENFKKKESRTLKKIDGQWKISNVNVVEVSSYKGSLYRRVILFKFKQPTTQSQIDKIRDTFYGLKEKVNGFENCLWIENKIPQPGDSYTHTLILDFKSPAVESVYAKHEDHLWLMKEGGKVIENISAFDYWIK
jgi:hypothetical protein